MRNTLGDLNNDDSIIREKSWKDFRDAGLLWWINMILHTFGWAIVFVSNGNDDIVNVYPARVKFRGFNEKNNDVGYMKVSKYINENAFELLKESEVE